MRGHSTVAAPTVLRTTSAVLAIILAETPWTWDVRRPPATLDRAGDASIARARATNVHQDRHVTRGTGLSRYRDTVSLPGAAAFSITGAVGRLAQAMVGLGALLLLTGLGRSYALAGLVAGAAALSQGLGSPWLSRVADRVGQRFVLRPQLLVHTLALVALVVAAQRQAPGWVLLASGVLVGLSMPQFGAYSRARWTFLLTGDDRILTALSIESLVDEAVFVVGPVLTALLVTTVAPAAGLLAAAGIVLVSGLVYVSLHSTEPPVSQRLPQHRGPSASRSSGLRVIVGVFLAIGAMFGFIEVGVVALTREYGHAGAAGLMLGLWATGSLISGTVYGSIQWRSDASRRFQIGAAAMAVGCLLIAVSSSGLTLVTISLVIAGLANAPTLITGNTLASAVVPHDAITEAYTWLSVAVFAGIAVGSPIGGLLIDRLGASCSLMASIGAGTLAAVLATACNRFLSQVEPP